MASRYWVGNGGSWNDSAHWSASSGGAGGVSVPGSGDDVFFNANSFTLALQTVLMTGVLTCKNINMTGVLNTPRFVDDGSKNQRLIVCAGLVFVAGINWQFKGGFAFVPLGSATYTINFAGITLPDVDSTYGTNASQITIEPGGVFTPITYLFSAGFHAGKRTLIAGNYTSLSADEFTLQFDDVTVTGLAAVRIDNSSDQTVNVVLGESQITIEGDSDMTDSAILLFVTVTSSGNVAFDSSAEITLKVPDTLANYLVQYLQSSTGAVLNNVGNVTIDPTSVGTLEFSMLDSGATPPLFQANFFTAALENFTLSLPFMSSNIGFAVARFWMHGKPGQINYLVSSTPGSKAKISSDVYDVSYLSVTDSNAEGDGVPATVLIGGVNGGNNLDWVFRVAGTLPTYSTSLITAVARVEQGISFPSWIIGGRGGAAGTEYGLFSRSSGVDYGLTLWRSTRFRVGMQFRVTSITIPLTRGVEEGNFIIPVLYFDGSKTGNEGSPIYPSAYPDAPNHIIYTPDHFDGAVKGTNNFLLEFQHYGTTPNAISLPIVITVHNEITGEDTTFTIQSIFEGIQPTELFGGESQYSSGIGIDPDVPATDDTDDLKTQGIIRPVFYKQFSGGEITSAPIAIITNPKTNHTTVVLSEGKLVDYDENLGTETLIGNVQESSSDVPARGGWYYNNYIYVPTPHDVSRYGPLDGTPMIEDEWWTGEGLAALEDTDYPLTLFSQGYLNHFGIKHIDGAAYFLDFKNGKGMVHKIKTRKTTEQGDTDDGSAYNILDLPDDYIPVTISSYGEDMVVSGSLTTDSLIVQGGACLFFFNPGDTTPSFYRQLELDDTICSVLRYARGTLRGLAGEISGGYRAFEYVGGDVTKPLAIIEDGFPPLQSAASGIAGRMVWGANTVLPIVTSGLYAWGSKSDLFQRGLHHIARTDFE